jgi:hypothetical protein
MTYFNQELTGSNQKTKPAKKLSIPDVTACTQKTSKKSATTKSKSFFIKKYPVFPEQYSFVENLLASVREKDKNLFKHILACNLLKLHQQEDKEGIYVPIPSVSIKKHLRGADSYRLREFLDTLPYDKDKGRCREFKVKDDFLYKFIEIGNKFTLEEQLSNPPVCLFTGKSILKNKKSCLYSQTKNREPKLISKAIRIIEENQCFVNLPAMENFLAIRQQRMDNARVKFGGDSREFEKEKGRYISDLSSYNSILLRKPKRITSDIWKFSPEYSVCATGRVHIVGGGLQNCSREMKDAAYRGIPDLHNYDLVGSQVNGLRQQLKMAGLNTDWLDSYIATPNNKRIYAERIGVSEECWKGLLLSIIMSAPLPKRFNGKVSCAILERLVEDEDNQDNWTSINEKLIRLRQVITPLKKEIGKWHRWLEDTYIPNNRIGTGRDYIRNACGKTLQISKHMRLSKPKRRRKLLAFFLQGLEAAFIHNLTALGPKYGFLPIANEHDGLVTIGTIPEAAVIEAGEVSGLASPRLVEKSFFTKAPDKIPMLPHRTRLLRASLLPLCNESSK